MPRATGRATQRALDSIHRQTAKAILDAYRMHAKRKKPAPPALMGQALKLLQITGSTDAARDRKQPDRLAGLLADYDAREGDPTTDLSQRELPDE
jgi:hypothetical protein